MLIRAHKLRLHISEWLQENQHKSTLCLDDIEWKQVEYLIELSLPYCQLGNAIAKTKDVTIHNVFPIYERLSNHLDNSIEKLKRKQEPWKRSIIQALEAAKQKLHKYYSKTNDSLGDIYIAGTILDPELKLSAFTGITWEPEWRQTYKNRFIEFYYDNYDEADTRQIVQQPKHDSDSLTSLLRRQRRINTDVIADDGEVGVYLTEGIIFLLL